MTITHQEIAQRAYEIWEREGKPAGQETGNWFRAEVELHDESRKKTKRPKKSTDSIMVKTPHGEKI